MFVMVYACDSPAGMIFEYTKVRTLLQRNDLRSPSPENDSLLQSFEIACCDFGDNSARPFRVDKLHRDYNSNVKMRASKRKREIFDRYDRRRFLSAIANVELGLECCWSKRAFVRFIDPPCRC